MTTEPCKPGVTQPGAKPIVLTIRGLTIPAFKNRKRAIVDRRTGKHRTLTEPRVKKLMDQITQLIESQLNFVLPTNEEGMLTGQQAHCWIASNLPLDDSRHWIPELNISSSSCDKGEEGATIVIEKL